MKKLITDVQKLEIEELLPEHSDALVAMGADLYRKGFIKGAVTTMVSVISGVVFAISISVLKEQKEQN